MRIKSKQIPLYTGKLIMIQLEGEEVMEDVMKRYNIDMEIADYDGIALTYSGNYIVAFGETVHPGIIAHECFHAVDYIYLNHGIAMDPKNDEPAAYLIGWLVEECHKFIRLRNDR